MAAHDSNFGNSSLVLCTSTRLVLGKAQHFIAAWKKDQS